MNKFKQVSKSLLSLMMVISIYSCQNNPADLSQIEGIDNTEIQRAKSEKKYLVKIIVKNKQEINDIASYGLDIFGSGKGGKFDAYLTNAQIELLKSKKVNFLLTNSSTNEGSGLPGGYHTVSQVISTIREYADKYPDITSLQDIGDSWEKKAGKSTNDIWSFTITNKKTQTEKASIVYISGMHARELAPVELNLRLMDLLLSNYGKDPQITKLIDTREIIFIPLANIDGRMAVEKGETMWRKNRHIDSANNGVDLNRNFDAHWNFEGVPSTPTIERSKREMKNPNSEVFSGQAPFSEPETTAIKNFLIPKKVTIMVDLHAYGEMVIWPPGYSTAPVADTPSFKKIGGYLTSKNGYAGGTSMELLYPSCGTTKDWGYEKHGAISFTIEVGGDGDGFRPPFAKVDKIWNENKDGFMYMIGIADNPKKAR